MVIEFLKVPKDLDPAETHRRCDLTLGLPKYGSPQSRIIPHRPIPILSPLHRPVRYVLPTRSAPDSVKALG
eukprot:3945846-Pyramimonas_sp.AAC.1